MPRTVQVAAPPPITTDLVQELSDIGLLSLRVQRGISVEPAGDVVSFEVTDAKLSGVMEALERSRLGRNPELSLATSSPMSVVAAGSNRTVNRDTTAATWEEAVLELGRKQGSLAVTDVPDPQPGDGDLLVDGVADRRLRHGQGNRRRRLRLAPAGRARLVIGQESLGRVREAPDRGW